MVFTATSRGKRAMKFKEIIVSHEQNANLN